MDVKISVVLPVYNVANYLRKCLDSLVNQTFEDFEVICVNDGSTDLSLGILEGYALSDSRFKIISQENKGLSGARNTGIQHVQGNYVLFVDSDDWLEENALEELYNHVKGFDSDITMFKFRYYNEDTNEFSENQNSKLEIIPESLTTSNFNYNDVLDILFKISHAPFNKLYKKSFLDKCSFPEGLIYEDLYFFYTVFLNAKKTSVIKEILYNYRVRDDSISTKGDEKSFDIFKVLKHVQQNLIDKKIYESVKDDFLMFIIVNLKFVYLRLNEELKDEFLNLTKSNYDDLNLGDVNNFDGWHYEDESFYKSIFISKNSEIFDLNYEKFQYKILSKHYQTLYETLEAENENLKAQLEEKMLKKVDLNFCENMSHEISVVIPVYNVEQYIRQCLDSIVNQTLGIENIEVIIVNDQTQDNSMDIINEYASKYPSFKIITNDVNKGLGESRNAGLENVTSDYVAFVDSDDFISDNTLKDSLLKIKESNADLLIYNIKTYTGNEFIEEESVHNQNFSENLLVDNIGNYPKLFFSTSACNKIYHKSLFPLINFSKGLYEDNVVTCNVLLNARNIYLNKDCDYFYRKNPQSITKRISKDNIFYLCNVISDLFKFNNENVDLLAINFINDVLFWIYYYDWSINDEIEFIEKLQSSIKVIEEKNINDFLQRVPEKNVYKEDILSLSKFDCQTFLAKFKYFNRMNKVKSQASLYIDLGSGFNENDKISIDYMPNENNKLTFDLSDFSEIKALRFDPLEGDFIKVKINNPNISDANCDNSLGEDYQLFSNLDPNYILDCEIKDKLTVDFDLIFLNKQDIANLLIDKNNIINESNQKPKKGRFNFLK